MRPRRERLALPRGVLALAGFRGSPSRSGRSRSSARPSPRFPRCHLNELRDAVAWELGALPVENREALRVRVVEELAYGDVARRLAITEPAARARVSRGLRALGRALDPPATIRDARSHDSPFEFDRQRGSRRARPSVRGRHRRPGSSERACGVQAG
ncbi:MAG: sigma-70 region 4 domain-containing protein [Actinobacteria bacterium]|nr:sigma-70 region 4 domain-containing protein [Actinomycetota bacterium]